MTKRLFICLLLVFALSGQVRRKTKGAKPPKDEEGIVQMLRELEKEWSEAGVHRDTKVVERIMADDWISMDLAGKEFSKGRAIAALELGSSVINSVEQKDFQVRLFGKDTAVVFHTDVEKSSYQGRDTSGVYRWMDVFVKRDNNWQVVASQTIKLQ